MPLSLYWRETQEKTVHSEKSPSLSDLANFDITKFKPRVFFFFYFLLLSSQWLVAGLNIEQREQREKSCVSFFAWLISDLTTIFNVSLNLGPVLTLTLTLTVHGTVLVLFNDGTATNKR